MNVITLFGLYHEYCVKKKKKKKERKGTELTASVKKDKISFFKKTTQLKQPGSFESRPTDGTAAL